MFRRRKMCQKTSANRIFVETLKGKYCAVNFMNLCCWYLQYNVATQIVYGSLLCLWGSLFDQHSHSVVPNE